MKIHLRDVTKQFGKLTALNNVSFSIEEGELFTILGPSGSGKTTLLRILAHIDSQSSGSIEYPPQWSSGKNILVFQDYLLFPHLTVYENIAFGLRAAKYKKTYINNQVSRYLKIFHLEDKSDVFPNQLSGGQKQRVAIARAMVLEPDLLLLDEPFANLDKQLKMETARFIRAIQRELGTTTVCVTHDLDEAFAMSDNIGVLIEGEIHQIGKARSIYFDPQTKETAQLLGPVNVVSRELGTELGFTPQEGHECYIRREALDMTPNEKGKGIIRHKEFVGMYINYDIDYGETRLKLISIKSDLELGERVDLSISQRYLTKKTISLDTEDAI